MRGEVRERVVGAGRNGEGGKSDGPISALAKLVIACPPRNDVHTSLSLHGRTHAIFDARAEREGEILVSSCGRRLLRASLT